MKDDVAKYEEITAYFKKRMEDSKKVWASRGKEARIAAHQARLAGPKTWRQMSGMELMLHEVKHIGNRPFMFGLLTIGLGALYAQTTFTDEMRQQSAYYQEYHAKDKGHH